MGKLFRLLVIAMLVMGVAVGAAFAGTTAVRNGGLAANATIGSETLGIARSIVIPDGGGAFNKKAEVAANVALGFTLGANLSTSNLLELTLAGGATFTGDPINFCAINGGPIGIQVAAGSPVDGDTVLTTSVSSVTTNTLSGDIIWATYNSCASNRALFPLKIATGTTGTSPTARVRMLSSGGVVLDNSSAVTVASVLREFNVVNASTNHTIDYLATNATGNKIINATGTASNLTADSFLANGSAAINIIGFTNTAVNNAAVNTNTATTIAGTVYLTDPTQSWASVNRVWLVPETLGCASGTVIAGTNSPSGTITLVIPSANFSATINTMGANLCIQGNGSSLSTRTIMAQGKVTATIGSVDYNTGITGATSNAQVWGINGYQAVIPWSQVSADAATYCLINNANTTGTDANVLFEAVSSQNSVSIASTSLGSVANKTSKLLMMDGTSACVSTNGSACEQTGASLATLGADKRYSARITITGSPANVHMTCVQKDAAAPNGLKRVMPVLTGSSGTETYYKQ